MQTLTSNYGRDSLELPNWVPTNALQYMLGRLHVLTEPEKVEKMIRQKCKKNGYTTVQTEWTVQAGLWIHAENGAEYRWVMKV